MSVIRKASRRKDRRHRLSPCVTLSGNARQKYGRSQQNESFSELYQAILLWVGKQRQALHSVSQNRILLGQQRFCVGHGVGRFPFLSENLTNWKGEKLLDTVNSYWRAFVVVL